MAISCPKCHATLQTPKQRAGRKACPKCGRVLCSDVPVAIPANGSPAATNRSSRPLDRRHILAISVLGVLVIFTGGIIGLGFLTGQAPPGDPGDSLNEISGEPAPAEAKPVLANAGTTTAKFYSTPNSVSPAAPMQPENGTDPLPAMPNTENADAPNDTPPAKPVNVSVPTPGAAAPEAVAAKSKEAMPQGKVLPRAPEIKIGVTEAEQRQINLAIAKGVRYLKTSLPTTTIGDGAHSIGRIALGGLTLLECGVPIDDSVVLSAAKRVRESAPTLRDTYSLSLAIMFLDRLDHPADRRICRTFAARLVAGQNGRGGWTYDCPLLTQPEETTLLTMLEQLPPLKNIVSNPRPLPNPLPKDGPLLDPLKPKESGPFLDPIQPKDGGPLQNPLTKQPNLDKGITDPTPNFRDPLGPKDPKLQDPLRKDSAPENVPANPPIDPIGREGKRDPARGPEAMQLPATLRNVPALRLNPGQGAGGQGGKETDDNSNTQFAIMGLWAARRHGVPMDRTLVLVERRFRSTQNGDGSWGYHSWDHKQADSMTCTGLLGMALALGLDLQLQGRIAGIAAADPAVSRGFAYLSSTIGKTPGPNLWNKGKGKKGGSLVGADARGDLYYLWSVERVAVTYGTPTIGKKNWYHWGAGVILAHQQADGSWRDRHAGVPDTSFSLLFLARANLVRGLPRLAAQFNGE